MERNRNRLGKRTLACCVGGYHSAVGELIACKREPNNAVGTYCDSEDRQFIEH